MRQEIELYLGGQSVEFAEPPEILFSYIRTDYTDPTVLRNSYSKTLNIEGTPNNNKIFNSIYHLDSVSDTELFNPAKRMDFKLFSNGDILEQGYAKLDKVNKTGKNISYDITLYGGLGEFLYNLSYDQTAEGSDTSRGGGEDRRLSSLVFYNETEPDKEFDFDITKDTVAEAWDALEKGTGATMWKYINFAPAYNGYPEDFDADKVLINTQGSTVPVTYNNNGKRDSSNGFPASLIQNDTTYRTYNNYALGEMPKEMTEWEMRDLRSYLQRPVLSMKGFIEAISNPINNGGYNVDLDSSFFNSNNPYYEKAWVTLPLLKKDETSETGQSAKTEATNNILSVSSMLGENYDLKYYLQGLEPGAVYNGIDLTFSFNMTMTGMPNEVYTTVYDYDVGFWGKDVGYYSSIFVQMVGEDANGNPLAASPIYNFTSPYGDEKEFWFIGLGRGKDPTKYCTRKSDFTSTYTPAIETNDINCLGRFVKTSGNNYVWKNNNGQSAFTVSLSDKLEYARVYFRVTKCYHWREKKSGKPTNPNCFEEQIFTAKTETEVSRRNLMGGYVRRELERCGIGGWFGATFTTDTITAATAVTNVSVVGSQVRYTTTSDVVRSGEHINKGDLLNFDGTPCDYLLSYCKLFNLYLSKDIYENTIHIRTRDTFYNGGTIDLDQFIDRSKDIKVSPLAMDSRWYDFAYPEDEKCGAAEDYDFNYGVEYGKNKVQTTYEFDSTAVDLFGDNIFQNGVQVQESSKYFTLRTVRGNPRAGDPEGPVKTVPTFLYNTVSYKLFASPNEQLSSCDLLPNANYTQTGYTGPNGKEDWLPKLELNNENEPIDGQNVLCFYGGFQSSPYVGSQQTIYYLTDDLAEMYVINGETPCWLWTKSEMNGSQQIAKGMTKLPIFSRMLYDSGNTKIEYTWDFGRVRDTYVPVKSYVDKATIYERWWADYIADLYNADTRVVEAYVKMEGKVVGDWLRAMYWWDNCYWVLTEINDYNITSYATTKCKFVKVNDIANYTSGIVIPTAVTPTATLVPSKYIIAATGETITARVVTSDGGAWHIEYPSYVHPSQVAGTGDTTITLRFDSNPNSDGRDFDIRAYRTVGTSTHFWQQGTESTAQTLTVTESEYITDYSAKTISGITFRVENKGNSTVTLSASNVDWLTIGPVAWNGDVATFNVDVTAFNLDSGYTPKTIQIRRAYIGVYVDGISKGTLRVYQLPDTVYLDPDGDSRTISYNNLPTGGHYTLSTEATQGDGAITVQNPYSSGIIMSAPANGSNTQRRTRVTLTLVSPYGSSSARFNVRQSGGGGSLTVSPTAITAEYAGGDKIMTVNSTLPWSATSVPEWISLSQTAGTSGQTTIIATFSENTGNTSRTGTITITDGTRTATVNVSQGYHIVTTYLTASPSALTYDYQGGTKYVNISSSSEWSASSIPSWISLDTVSGPSGTSILSVTATLNDSTESGRSGSFTLSNDTDTITVAVSQANKVVTSSLNVSPSSLYFDYTGGTKYLNVSDMDYTWTATSKPNWVVLSQSTGAQGYSMVGVTASENTGTTTRTGEIIFSDGHFTKTVSVAQPVSSSTKTLSFVPNLVYVENSGGTPIIEIHYGNRNGDDVTVTCDQSWCVPRLTEWNGDVGYVVLNVANYGVNMERTATITATAVLEQGLTATATVRQKELPYITLNPVFIEFEQTGGTANIILQSNTNWIIDIDNDS